MKRILFSWEMGVGLGHLAPLCSIADSYVAAGHHCCFAIPVPGSLVRLRPNWANVPNVRVDPFPGWFPVNPVETPLVGPSQGILDVLMVSGFENARVIEQHSQWWDALIRSFKPDLVVAEFAPGCTWMTRGSIPVVTIGNGYTVLPNCTPIPSLDFWKDAGIEGVPPSQACEFRMLSCINDSRRRYGFDQLENIASVFRGDWSFPCTFRSLDPYRSVRNEPVFAPWVQPVSGFECAISLDRWQASHSGPKGFVYYSIKNPLFRHMIEMVLRQSEFPCVIYAPEYSELRNTKMEQDCHLILDRPMDLNALSQFAFCIHPGGLGLSAASALARLPQLLTPISLESLATAHALSQQSAAIVGLPYQVETLAKPSHLIRIVRETIGLRMNLDLEFQNIAVGQADTMSMIRKTIDSIALP